MYNCTMHLHPFTRTFLVEFLKYSIASDPFFVLVSKQERYLPLNIGLAPNVYEALDINV